MNTIKKALWKNLAIALLTAGLALPVCAQGQTPTRPGLTPRQPGSSLSTLGGSRGSGGIRMPSRSGSRIGPTQPGRSTGRGRAGSSRLSPSSSKTPAAKAPLGADAPGAAKAPATKAPTRRAPRRGGGATPTSVQGGGAGGTAIRSVPAATPPAISVKGGAKVYEPFLEREIEYKPVPDVGEPMTVAGPMAVSEFLEMIVMATEWNYLATPEVLKINLDFSITETKPIQALDILKFHKIYYEFDPETRYLTVMTQEQYLQQEYGETLHEVFIPEHVGVAYIESLITSLLSTQGRIITDPRTSHIYVWDTKDNLDKMRETIAELDVPLERAEFFAQHADLSNVEAILTSMKSETATLIADPRTGQIIIWELPDILEKMRKAVTQLDVPQESRIFRPRHLDASALVESIEILLSETGVIQTDPRFNTLIVKDLPNRLKLIEETINTLDKELETRTWVIKYADPDVIAEQVEVLLPEDTGIITVNYDIHQVTITGLSERLDEIDKLIETWDIKRRQVQIESYQLTASNDVARQLGLNWTLFDSAGDTLFSVGTGGSKPNYAEASPDSGQRIQMGQLPQAIPEQNWITGAPLNDILGNPIFKDFAGNRISAVVDYLESNGLVSVLSEPRVTVQDGEEAVFQRTSMVPYVTQVTYGYGGGYGGYGGYGSSYGGTGTRNTGYYSGAYRPSSRIDFLEVGTILRVLPRISEDGNILLDISAEESTYQMREVIGADETSTVPEKMQNSAQTQVMVHDGQTIVIGGLRTDNLTDSVEKVPFLGDLPLLGRAFKNTRKERKNQELLIFINSTIVDEFTSPEAERLAVAEEDLASGARYDHKNSWGRLGSDATRNKNEIGVSIGQSGHMHSGGVPVTMDKLRHQFASLSFPEGKKVVIREHPRAPSHVAREITEIALEWGMKVKFDTTVIPFVPAYRDSSLEETDLERTDEALPEEQPTGTEAEETGSAG